MAGAYSIVHTEDYAYASLYTLYEWNSKAIMEISVANDAIYSIAYSSPFRMPKIPSKELTDTVMDFMDKKGFLPDVDFESTTPYQVNKNLNLLGLAISKDGYICSIHELPDGFETLEGIPYLCDLVIPEGAKIPDNLTVHGDLILEPTRTSIDAKGLKVDGKIFASCLKKVAVDVPDEALVITEEDIADFGNKLDIVQYFNKEGNDLNKPQVRTKAQVKNLKMSGAMPMLKLQKTK